MEERKDADYNAEANGVNRRDLLKGALALGATAAVGGLSLNLSRPGSAAAASQFSSVKACVFDAYGTLFDFNSAIARNRARVGEVADKVSDLWRTKQIDYTWLRSLMRQYKDFWSCTSDALDYTLEVYGVKDKKLREDLLNAYLELDAFSDVPGALRELKKRGYSVHILSNGTPNMLKSAVKSSGLESVMDSLMSVDEVKVFKPDLRVYQIAVDTLGLKEHQIAFMSSNAWDAAGAVNFGFKVVWVNRGNKIFEKLGVQPHAIIKSMAELPDILGG